MVFSKNFLKFNLHNLLLQFKFKHFSQFIFQIHSLLIIMKNNLVIIILKIFKENFILYSLIHFLNFIYLPQFNLTLNYSFKFKYI